MWLKICGVQEPSTASWLAEQPIDAVGINRYPDSSRYVEKETARAVSEAVHETSESTLTVGVYVNEAEEDIRSDVEAFDLDVVQLHGDESPDEVESLSEIVRVIKAFRVDPDFSEQTLERYDPWAHLLDAYRPDRYGGTGETAPWDRVRNWTGDHRIILAGGLNPANIRDAFETVEPWGLDVNSGVENESGTKDRHAIDQLLSVIEDLRSE